MKFINAIPKTTDLVVEMATISVDVETLARRLDEATMMPIDPSKDDMDDIIRQMQMVTDYLTAAKKGLNMTDGIKNQDARDKHKNQIMSNMNRIRAKHKRVERMFDEWWENHRVGSDRRKAPTEQPVTGPDNMTGQADNIREE